MFRNPSAKQVIKIAIGVLIATLISFLLFYVMLPPLNPYSRSFWFFMTLVLAIYGISIAFFHSIGNQNRTEYAPQGTSVGKKRKSPFTLIKEKRVGRIYAIIVLLPIVVIIIGSLFSSTIFNANSYANVIQVKEEDFASDMPEADEVKNIALLDTESARILGTRKLGALANVVSQYVVSNNYTQINYQGQPVKVANLEYDGFFKWLNNRDTGIPGYIMVDAVGNSAEYQELERNMIYSESAYFSKDLERALRFRYPTKIFDNISFEVDETGKVYYIVSCASPKVGLFGAMDISEVIIFDPVDGSSERYDVDKVPTWVDIVYEGYLACEKYDWKGLYSGGYWNSIIGQKDCKQTTDDFGYLMLDDDVWYVTGVTSVTADESNIGFILSCARTGEYKFYPVIGAEEYSAMGAAEGEVQEKGYDASFPALVNVAGEPTYIMVLKDASKLVKLYALVNVEQYNIVATGETQAAARAEYIKLLAQSGIDMPDINTPDINTGNEVEITLQEIQYLPMNGTTKVYLTAEDGTIFSLDFNEDNEGILFAHVGSRLKVSATLNEKSGIMVVYAWEILPEE